LLKNENHICADCSAPDPKWASANIGVFICTKCSSAHRRLGTHISKVLSVTLDEWSDDEIESMIEVGGNSSANSIYEAYFPKGISKPNPDSSNEERTKFIRSKYELQEFLKPSLRIISSKSSFKSCDSGKDVDSGFDSDSSKKTTFVGKANAKSFKSLFSFWDQSSHMASSMFEASMVGFIGSLKVKVIRGINLAIRDMLTSDPYVVLTLGQQKVQTNIIKSNLNPIWNQELKLSIPQRYGALKLQVYDYDTFSADDIMGEAEIDLQPMITAAMAFGDVLMLGNMQIGKWLKTSDNALIKDSTVNILDGKVKQEVFLKLQNVESGEIELELEWIPLE